MQLLIRRSQRVAQKMFGSAPPTFCSTVRAQYTDGERALINKYELGGSVLYDSKQTQQYLERVGSSQSAVKTIGFLALAKMGLTVTVASLQRGHDIQCADLGELLECEEAIIQACRNVKGFVEAAESFDGREIVVDLDENAAVAR